MADQLEPGTRVRVTTVREGVVKAATRRALAIVTDGGALLHYDDITFGRTVEVLAASPERDEWELLDVPEVVNPTLFDPNGSFGDAAIPVSRYDNGSRVLIEGGGVLTDRQALRLAADLVRAVRAER